MGTRSLHAQMGCTAPHFLAVEVAAGHNDAGKVDAGDHRQRRAEQARSVGEVNRVHRGCVYLDEHLSRARLGNGFGANGQRLRWRPAGLDDDRVHLLLLGVDRHSWFLSGMG